MAFRGFDQLNPNDLQALFGTQGGNNASIASLLLAQQQQLSHQAHAPGLASIAALNGGNLHSSQFAAYANSIFPGSTPSIGHHRGGGGLTGADPYQSQTTQLLTALLEQQQREDQKKAALIQQLNSALQCPLPQVPSSQGLTPSQADSLIMMLRQQQQQKQQQLQQQLKAQQQIPFQNQGNAANPLSLFHNASSQLSGAPAAGATAVFGAPQPVQQAPSRVGPAPGGSAGQVDATIAKLLQSQQQPQAPTSSSSQVPSASGPSTAAALAAHLNGASATTALLDSAAALSLPADRRRKGRTGTFPQKLHQMLSDLERQEGGSDIASFLPHGRAFAIHKPRDFVKHVMPKYFRMSRFSSFQRQLNLYDFQRITEGPDKGSYYHELFVQGRPILSTMMKRNKIKGVKNLKQQEGEDEEKEEDKEDEVASKKEEEEPEEEEDI